MDRHLKKLDRFSKFGDNFFRKTTKIKCELLFEPEIYFISCQWVARNVVPVSYSTSLDFCPFLP